MNPFEHLEKLYMTNIKSLEVQCGVNLFKV